MKISKPPIQEENREDNKMYNQKSVGEWFAQEDIFRDKTPIDGPFVQEHPREVEGTSKILPRMFSQERETKKVLQGENCC